MPAQDVQDSLPSSVASLKASTEIPAADKAGAIHSSNKAGAIQSSKTHKEEKEEALLTKKENRLRALIKQCGRVIVAYSGGVDSTLVAQVAYEELHADHMLAVIARSPSLPASELEAALALGNTQKFPVRVIDTEEHLDPLYQANSSRRCYYCKKELYSRLQSLCENLSQEFSLAEELPHAQPIYAQPIHAQPIHAQPPHAYLHLPSTGMQKEKGPVPSSPDVSQEKIGPFKAWTVLDGANCDDLGDHRPGRIAAKEYAVLSPLILSEFSKSDVRKLAQKLGLHNYDKPAAPCLASRIPYGQTVTPARLAQIEKAEDFIRETFGIRVLRVRAYDDLARIEVEPSDFPQLTREYTRLYETLRKYGFRDVTLDPRGFRSGSLNEALSTLRPY